MMMMMREDDIADEDDHEHDEDGHEGGDELEPHDTDDDLHLQAADMRQRLSYKQRYRGGSPLWQTYRKVAKLNGGSSSETEDDHSHTVMADNDSRSMPPPPPLVGPSVHGVKSIDLTRPMASSTPNTPAPFIPISEETVFLDPEPPMPSIATSSPHSGDSWMNYSSNSSDDFSGLSEQIKAVTSGRQTGNNSSDEASSDYDSSIISQTEVMLKRYKSQQDAFETAVAAAAAAAKLSTPPLTPQTLLNKKLNTTTATVTTTTTASPTSSTTSSLKSVKALSNVYVTRMMMMTTMMRTMNAIIIACIIITIIIITAAINWMVVNQRRLEKSSSVAKNSPQMSLRCHLQHQYPPLTHRPKHINYLPHC
ncbi:hypothetical protein EVAR_72076_1 [Eumeta japonica]|uniref:Uncharacterized protein n=1 Tax=Eumeta variegata TaxID=151549 RepID=A0A4C1TB41_EUMVA|nr:hypothetical protein EVAR_72076_1 [Eumeta japonica]